MSDYGHIEKAVAVVGVSAILPDAPDAQTFWQNLCAGRYSISEVDPERWDPADYYDPDPQAVDKTYSKIGGWVRQYEFDPFKWGMPIPPNVQKSIDVAQKWAISAARAALLDYGWPKRPLDMARTAVIIGNAMSGENHYITSLRIYAPEFLHALEETPEFQGLSPEMRLALIGGATQQMRRRIPEITEDTMPGELANIIAGRVANMLNLGGPNFIADAACASSFAALEAAVRGLHAGHFDAVLTGGVDRNMGASTFVKFCKIGALSPDGSRPFDADANGFVMGEGAAILLLKRLADAERDGDRIYAVIRGIGGSSDGKGRGITAPNPAGQAQAVRRAWQDAGLSPATAGYIEAHGTSTRVGDVAELEGLMMAFREFDLPTGHIPVGSVKSNIGHLKGGAGAAGLLKTVLALYHGQIPPSINVRQLNPKIDFAHMPFRIQTTLSAWEANGTPRRAGVSSFGFGGTNFHVVVEEHRPGMLDRHKTSYAGVQISTGGPEQPRSASGETASGGSASGGTASGRVVVAEAKAPYRGALLLGGANAAELKSRLEGVLQDARNGRLPPRQAPAVADLRAAERLAIDFGNAEELLKRGEKALAALEKNVTAAWKPLAAQGIFYGRGTPGRVALMFPGQGSQYANMLRELYQIDAPVANTFIEADAVMTPLLGRPLSSYIFTENDDKASIEAAEEKLKDTTITQPAVLTVNVALTRLLAGYGIEPEMVIGHSLGEYAALVAAGVLSFADALHVVSARGREMSKVSVADNGCMAAVMAPLTEVEKVLAEIDGYVTLANVNSPSQVVIGGETPAVDKAIAAFQARDFRAVKIPVSHAFHTRIVAPASEPLKRVIAAMKVCPPRLPIVANVTGELYPQSPAEIVDILGQQVASPVQFVKGIQKLYALGARVFVEVGPKRVLTALAEEILQEHDDVTILFTNHPRKGTLPSFNEALCGLWAAGVGCGTVSSDAVKSPIAVQTRPVQAEQPPVAQSQPAPIEQPSVEQARPTPTTMPVVQPLQQSVAIPQLDHERIMALGQLFAEFLARGQQIYAGGLSAQSSEHLAVQQSVRPPADGRLPLTGSVVISGAALGLPGQNRHVFAADNIERILRGEQFIDPVPEHQRRQMAARRITRLVKSESGATFEVIDNPDETIKLAGRRGYFDLAAEFGVPAERVEALDITSQLAIAAGIDALRDAGIPLVMHYRLTSKGTYLPDRWMLPEALRDETGVIFASAWPGLERMGDEVARYKDFEALNKQLDMLTQLAEHASEQMTHELERRIAEVKAKLAELDYHLDRKFIFRVLAMGHSQFAEHIGARGPNTHVNAACASSTHAVAVAEDWIRSGRCRRVIVIAGDDATSETMMQWIGAGMLATGAATTEERLERAALPFDARRHGTILGMGAAALVIEAYDAVLERGMRPICELLSSETANSAFHGTRLDVEHVSQVMERVVSKAEARFGLDRRAIAPYTVFVSHETFTPARGGSAAAEIHALRRTFGDMADQVVIANTKGYTGHAMGVGIEDVLAVKALEYGIVPPVANINNGFQPDPELGNLRLSRGGTYPVHYALRLGAGFGSQIAMTLLRKVAGVQERLANQEAYNRWLAAISGQSRVELEVVQHTLRIKDAGPPVRQPAPSQWQFGQGPTAWVEVVGRQEAAGSRQQSAGSGQQSAGSDQQAAGSRQQSAGSGQQSAGSDQRAAGSGQRAACGEQLAAGGVQLATDAVRERVLALVSEKTGYPVEMLDLDLDLEADLGIDTVKQAEVFATIREAYGIPRREDLKLRDYNTLNKVIAFVYQNKPEPAISEQPSVVSSQPATDAVRERVLALVSEKTGYPVEMLDLDLDLEADLGIDTVKQAEVFATIREAYGIPRREDLKLRDYNTLNKVIAFVYQNKPELRVESGQEAAVGGQQATVSGQQATISGQGSAVSGQQLAAGGRRVAAVEQYVRRVPCPVLRPTLDLCKPTGVKLEAGERVIVIADQGSVSKYLGYRLRPRKVQVLTLKDVTPQVAESQVAAWLAEGSIAGVYDLVGLDAAPPVAEMDLPRWRDEQTKRAKLLHAVMRKLPENAFLVCATRMGGLHGYGEDGAINPLGGALVGWAKAYAQERRSTLVKAVDFEAEADERSVAGLLIDETLSDPAVVEVGYRHGRRFGVGLVERPVDETVLDLPLGPDSVWLITGGAGGISLPIVADLVATAGGGTFYLTGRTPTPDPNNPDLEKLNEENRKYLKKEIAQRIQNAGGRPTPVMVEQEIAALERQKAILDLLALVKAAGGVAHYRVCDVTDAQAVLALVDEIRQAHGRLDVVIHAAGIERSRLLADKSMDEFAQVYDVKADGFFNLLKACETLPQPPRAMVVYSSVAGRFGNAGQTDYSAANDLLSRLVASMQGGPTKAIAIDWSAWAEVGMATRGSIPQIMQQAGIELLRPERAAPAVRREITARGSGGEVVIAGALGVLAQSRDPDGGVDWNQANARLAHDLILAGQATALDSSGVFTFERDLDPQEPFLRDHAIDNTPLLPGVMGLEGFAEVACLAASRLGGAEVDIRTIEGVQFKAPLKFYRQQPRRLRWRVQVRPQGDALVADVRLESGRDLHGQYEETVHFEGRVHLQPAGHPIQSPVAPAPTWNGAPMVDPATIYELYFHGPAFQVLAGVQAGDGRVVGRFNAALPAMTTRPAATLIPPLLIELCLQTAGIWEIGQSGMMALPVAIERVVLHRSEINGDALYAEMRPRYAQDGALYFDGHVVDSAGNVYLELEGYRTAPLSRLDNEALLERVKKIQTMR